MSEKSMTNEEYLRARGWTPRGEGEWDPPLRPQVGPTCDVYFAPRLTAEAVKVQLAEDRAALAFVFSRSVFRATFRDGSGLTVDFVDATIETMSKEPQR